MTLSTTSTTPLTTPITGRELSINLQPPLRDKGILAEPVASKCEPRKIFAGKKIILSGTTGFLGKIVLSLLLARYPEISKVYTLIRVGGGATKEGEGEARANDEQLATLARERFYKTVAFSEALAPVKALYSSGQDSADLQHIDTGYLNFLQEKIYPLAGDITCDNCGISITDRELLEREGVDLIINSAGLVDFDPQLDVALAINALGAKQVVALAQKFKAALLHVSTCFVAGTRNGEIKEDDPVLDRIPAPDPELQVEFKHEQELQRLQELIKETLHRAEDAELKFKWRKAALKQWAEQSKRGETATFTAAQQTKWLELTQNRERKLWLARELKRVGMERSKFWGWPNTYTFTKALGEQIIAAAVQKGELQATIVRPAIVESALEYPAPGWNEGFTTTAPLIMFCKQGLTRLPYAENLLLDIVPCDIVSSVILAAGAAVLSGKHKLIYQAATSDINPFTIRQSIEWTSLALRLTAQEESSKGLRALIKRYRYVRPISKKWYKWLSVPLHYKLACKAQTLLETLQDCACTKPFRSYLRDCQEVVSKLEKQTKRISAVLALFMPFIAENKYVFRSDNVRELMSIIPKEEQDLLYYKPAGFKWFDYWINTHLPGLKKWVFPALEKQLKAGRAKAAKATTPLLESLKTSSAEPAPGDQAPAVRPSLGVAPEEVGVNSSLSAASLKN